MSRGSAESSVPLRDPSVDRVRGLAVLLMLGANLAPYLVPQPHPIWYRMMSTFCAPTFVFLFGMMVGERPRDWAGAWKRSAALLAIAALLDVVAWGIRPFEGFDVLYAVALSLPFLRLVATRKPLVAAAVAALIFVVTPLLQGYFGYGREGGSASVVALRAGLLDGWFPLFPWLGIGVFGVFIGQLRRRERLPSLRAESLLGGFLLGAGAFAWWVFGGVFPARGGYAEYFYPPTFGPLALNVGPALLALRFAGSSPAGALLRPLELLGRRSLFFYLGHILIIGRIVHPLHPVPSWLAWVGVYGGLLVGLILFAALAQRLFPKPKSFLGRLIFGQ
jgi:uncharacterized membrane protein